MNAEGILEKQAFSAGVSALVWKAEGMKTFITKARRASIIPEPEVAQTTVPFCF